ncbi:MAG: phosphoribosyltransferase [Proteobacteria bacterium]|nr:phosphoribosyltransferase [Pseudomonadota bacterium]
MTSSSFTFADRKTAGIQLGAAIRRRSLAAPGVVLGLPRGGVPVAFEISRVLGAPLDVMPVRKIAMPDNPEFAIGAIAGKTVVRESNPPFEVSTQQFAELARLQRVELRRRERIYRAGLLPLNLKGLDVLLVDDGLATGCTMLAAVREANRLGASRVIVAAPVASDAGHALVRAEADEVIALRIEPRLSSVGAWYDDFTQVEDFEVCELLARCRAAADRRVQHDRQPDSRS